MCGQTISTRFSALVSSWLIRLRSADEVLWCQAMKLADELTRRGVRMLDQNGREWVSSMLA